MRDDSQLRRVERAMDGYLLRFARMLRIRRRRMKALLATIGFGAAALLIDALLVLQAQTTQRSPLLEWWAPLLAVATALIAFASLKTAFTAHRDYTDARIKEKASKEVVDVELKAMRESVNGIRDDVEGIRGDVSKLRELIEHQARAKEGHGRRGA